ncbi:MAG: hypothetical protein AB1746_10885, partial [Candidatus Zixiibacteriota bacterium]
MKTVDRGSRVSRVLLPTLFILLILATPHVFGGQVVLTSANLPYIVNTNDTVTFSGTKITTATYGIYVRDGATNVLVNLGTDTLVFGTANGDNNFGIRIARSLGSPQNVTVKGGWIIHAGSSTTNRNNCIELAGCTQILIDSVSTIVNGTNGKCLTSVPPEGREIVATNGTATSWRSSNKNVEIRGGRYRSNVVGYTSRCMYDGATIHLGAKTAVSGTDYNFKVHDLVIENAPCQGIVAYGVSKIYNCTITVDSRNFMYTYPTDNFCHSQANAFCILARLADAGSEFHDNVLLAGTNYYGADGGFEVEGCIGTAAAPIRFYDNYINVHRGWDVYYGNTVRAKGFKMRVADEYNATNGDSYSPNKYIRITGNNINVYACTDTVNYKAYGPIVSGFYIAPHYLRNDESVIIENNRINSIVLDDHTYVGSSAVQSASFELLLHDDLDEYTIRYNRLISNDAFYRFGGYDGGGRSFSFYEDTLIAVDTAKGPTVQYSVRFWPGDIGTPLTDNYIKDSYYVPDTLWKLIEFRPAMTTGEVTLQRTLDMYVRGNNNLPVVNAACSVWNDYNRLVLSGITDSGGRVSGVVSYLYESVSSGDSLAFNDFRIKAVKGTDVANIGTFTVGPGPAGGTDTLTLNNTVGTGVWGAGGDTGEDSIPPER